jgi:hypothetical protein
VRVAYLEGERQASVGRALCCRGDHAATQIDPGHAAGRRNCGSYLASEITVAAADFEDPLARCDR